MKRNKFESELLMTNHFFPLGGITVREATSVKRREKTRHRESLIGVFSLSYSTDIMLLFSLENKTMRNWLGENLGRLSITTPYTTRLLKSTRTPSRKYDYIKVCVKQTSLVPCLTHHVNIPHG